MTTFIYLLSYLSCLSGPGTLNPRGVCAWLDVNRDQCNDLRDWAVIQNDAGCIRATYTMRPERLIVESCP